MIYTDSENNTCIAVTLRSAAAATQSAPDDEVPFYDLELPTVTCTSESIFSPASVQGTSDFSSTLQLELSSHPNKKMVVACLDREDSKLVTHLAQLMGRLLILCHGLDHDRVKDCLERLTLLH